MLTLDDRFPKEDTTLLSWISSALSILHLTDCLVDHFVDDFSGIFSEETSFVGLIFLSTLPSSLSDVNLET